MMGYFAKKTTSELLARRSLPLGSWLVEMFRAVPGVSAGSALHYALLRMDFAALLKNAVTYTGTASEVNAIASAFMSAPSVMSITSDGKQLTIGVGALGFPKKAKGQFHHFWDWRVTLTPSGNGTSVELDVVDARTVDDVLANVDVFKRLVASLTDVLIDGVHVEHATLTDADALWSVLESADDTSPERIEWTPLPDLSISVNTQAGLRVELFEQMVPPTSRDRLDKAGLWPVFARGSTTIPMSQLDHRESRLVATFLRYEARNTADGAPEKAELADIVSQLASAPLVSQTVVGDHKGLANQARLVPVLVGGLEQPEEDFPIQGVTASACKITPYYVKLSKNETLELFATTAAHDGGTEYGLTNRVGLDAWAARLPTGMESEWRVRIAALKEPRLGVGRFTYLNRTSHDRSTSIRSSVAYLELMEATVEVLAHQGEVGVWFIDRRKGWSGTIERGALTSIGQRPQRNMQGAELQVDRSTQPVDAPAAISGADPSNAPVSDAGRAAATDANPARWLNDPTGRHQLRYWDGTAWTQHVSDGGATNLDPMSQP